MSYQNKTYIESEGTYHYVTAAGANYSKAKSICKNNFQSKLAVLNTQQLFDKAKSLIDTGTFFIGLHKPNNSVPYQWLDGSAFNRSLINGPNITNGNAPGCRGVVIKVPGQSNPVNLIAYDCASGQNVLCFTPAPITTTQEATTKWKAITTTKEATTTTTQKVTATTKQEATTATEGATTNQAFLSTTSYDTTTTTLSPTTNAVLTKVQPTTQLYNSTQMTTTGLTNTQSANAGGLQLGIVVGIPLGVVFLLILLIALIVWLKRRGGDKSNEADAENDNDEREVRLNVIYDTGDNYGAAGTTHGDHGTTHGDHGTTHGDHGTSELYSKIDKRSPTQETAYDVIEGNNTARIMEPDGVYSGLNNT
uniref:cell wall integrity and stress response component 3-like n=1 Tax=Ciona intestinalis TaxID=7719 RepID=UPI000EF4D814|nr:cell wall integrity and stress response component 3-like [Ciona intestinalis]|eukprot:XP_026695863.1 cell wall integrity and stress response component 3-like [Ciona intestinalis]